MAVIAFAIVINFAVVAGGDGVTFDAVVVDSLFVIAVVVIAEVARVALVVLVVTVALVVAVAFIAYSLERRHERFWRPTYR